MDLRQEVVDHPFGQMEFWPAQYSLVFTHDGLVQQGDDYSAEGKLQDIPRYRVPLQHGGHQDVGINDSVVFHDSFLVSAISSLISSSVMSAMPSAAAIR